MLKRLHQERQITVIMVSHMGTILQQIACETIGLSGEQTVCLDGETKISADLGGTSASRQTLVTGEAVRRACLKVAEDMKSHSLEELDGREYRGDYLAKTDAMDSSKKNPVLTVAYGYATQVVLLNEGGTVEKIIAAHDVGKALNPLSVEGQMEGGVIMSMGYALTEDYPLHEGRPLANFGTLGFESRSCDGSGKYYYRKSGLISIWGCRNWGDYSYSYSSGYTGSILSAG